MQILTTSGARGNAEDRDYDAFRGRLQRRLEAATGDLFTTDVPGLWDAYLAAFPAEVRQHHTCSACRRFVRRYGGLVTLDERGRPTSALWDVEDADDVHRPAVAAMLALLRGARVTGVFLAADQTWGTPVTGAWTHLAVAPPAARRFRHALLTPGQARAAKREDHGTLLRALEEFDAATISRALTLLRADALYRSEKVLGQAEFLAALHEAVRHGDRAHVVWRAVAAAPAGLCHPRSGMVGTLLEDLAAGLAFEDVAAKFRAKMHPLLYQRPQAAPTAGNLAQAERLVAELGLAPALERRFARLDEVEALWRPPVEAAPTGSGVFGHLAPKGTRAAPWLGVPAQAITFEKFARTVLPTARALEVLAPSHGAYLAFVTAVHADAPPLLQWDAPEARNPVSWYLYHGGSPAAQWQVPGGLWVDVTAVALNPSRWRGRPAGHHGTGAVLVIAGCRDTRTGQGNAIFPETLRSELHAVRATIEAYSQRATLAGLAEASACGLSVGKDSPAHVRVLVDDARMEYRIDRWD